MRVEGAARVVGLVEAVVELAGDVHVATVDARIADALPHAGLVLVHLGGVDVAIADIECLPDGLGGLTRVDLENAKPQLRDFRAVVEFDGWYVAHGWSSFRRQPARYSKTSNTEHR